MTVFEINNKIEEALHPTIDKYAMYLRKSRADIEAEKDGEGETLARHKKILTDLAVRKGLYVEKIYEEVVSGETIEARAEIQKLITDCYAGKYRGIIVIDISRLSRGNQGDAQIILDCLKFSNRNQGLLVVTPSKTYDIAHNHDDEEYMEFELFMSRREYKMIKRRLDRGKIQAIVEGNYMSAFRPFGYDIVKTRNSRYLVANEYEAPYVKKIYEWAVNDKMTLAEIANRLDALGVPPRQAEYWCDSSIRKILTNPVYIGKVKWCERVKIKAMEDGELVNKVARYTEQYMEYDGKHDGLVDEEIFHAVKFKFPEPRTKSKHSTINPLAGIMRCKKCGMVFRYKTYERSRNRLVHGADRGRCKIKSALVDDVMDALKYALKLHIEDFTIKIDSFGEVDETDIKNEIEKLRNELRQIDTRRSRLFDGWESGTISDNEFVERKTVLADKVTNINNQITELESAIPEQVDYKEKIATLHQAINMINDPSIDMRNLNRFLKEVLDRVEFSRENNSEFILDVYLN